MRIGTLVRTTRIHAAACLFALAGGPVHADPATPPPAPSPATVVATVNGEVITLAQLDGVMKQRPVLAPLTPAQVHQLREELVREMTDDLLLRQFLRKNGPAVAAAEVEQHFKALGESLGKQGKTPADFFRDIGQTEAQARETWTAMLQLSRYVKQHISDEQLKQYYAANKDHFDRVELKVSHIVVRAGQKATPGERDAARLKLTSLRAEIAAGKLTFADAARKHSQCPSAPQGGDLGTITRKGMLTDETFCAAAFALKPGQISDVVATEFGFHLIWIADRKPGTPSAFEKCVEEVRESFTDDFRIELTNKLRKQAHLQVNVP